MIHTELKLNMHIIMEEFERYEPIVFLDESLELNIEHIRLYHNKIGELNDNTVYIMDYSKIKSVIQTGKRLNVMCPDGDNCNIEAEDNLNVICLGSMLSKEELFDILQNIFDRYSHWNEHMIDVIVNNQDKNDLLEVAAQMLKNPLVLFDYTLQPVFNTEHDIKQYEGTLWEKVIALGYSLTEGYPEDAKKKFLSNLNNRKTPFLYKNIETEKYTQLFVNLYIDKTRVGSLGLIDRNVPFSMGQISLVGHLKNIVEAVLNHNERILYSLDNSTLIEKMLKGFFVEEKMVQYHLKKYRWKVNDPYFIIVFDNLIKDFPDAYKSFRFKIGQFFKESKTIPFNEHLILLLKADNYYLDQIKKYDDFIEFLKNLSIKCGVSMKFDNFLDLKYFFRQAVSALREGKKKDSADHCFFYRDYFLEDIVSSLEKDTNIRSFCHPKILVLKDHDEETGSEYIRTIYNYMLCGRNLTDAAETLHIHRNTLTYRLSKINELVELDLNDNRQLYHILTSCRFVEFL